MNRRYLGDLEVSEIGLGCLSMTAFYDNPPDPDAAISTIHRALDLGINFVDTADFYASGENEKLLGRALAGRRKEYIVATKFGQMLQPDGSISLCARPEWAREACESSLLRMNLDVIDMYYLHRVDPEVPIADTIGAMSQLVKEGKVRRLGLCEVSATTLRTVHKIHRISAVQTEYSLWTRDVEAGILDVCDELGIGFVAYSPLGRGFLTGGITSIDALSQNDMRRAMPRFQKENFARNAALLERLKRIGERERATPAQIALAWLLSRKPPVIPLPGSSKIAHLEENAASATLQLTPQTLTELDAAFAADAIAGPRYGELQMARVNR